MKTKGSKWLDIGRIEGGDWDVRFDGHRNPALEETPIHQSVYERIVEGVEWRNTIAYARKSEAILQGRVIDGCASIEQLNDRYSRLDQLIRKIPREGWALEEEVGGDFRDNISVSISRAGGFLLASGGAHRLAIAKILRLPEIRVYVLMRHERWQAMRDRVAHGRPTPLSHPDLEDLKI